MLLSLDYIGTELGNEKNNVMQKINPKSDIRRSSKFNNVQQYTTNILLCISNYSWTVFTFFWGELIYMIASFKALCANHCCVKF
jgi:hypothetical protein